MHWRYIPPFCASGQIQMAVDTWMFEQYRQGHQPPTLRFYEWPPASLSLGYFQKHWPSHWNTLTWQGKSLDLVRRPSGGRGVLHQGDLTYSCCLPMGHLSRREAYVTLCQFLIEGWKTLGLPLEFGRAGRGYHKEANCFRLATGADLITPMGLKFIGSAQLWRGNDVLQHGSMSLAPSAKLYQLVFPEEPALKVPWSNPSIELEAIIEILKQSFETALNIELTVAPLSSSEWAEVFTYCSKPPTHSDED